MTAPISSTAAQIAASAATTIAATASAMLASGRGGKPCRKLDDDAGDQRRQHHQHQALVLQKALLGQHQRHHKDQLEREDQPERHLRAAAIERAVDNEVDDVPNGIASSSETISSTSASAARMVTAPTIRIASEKISVARP